MTRAGAPLGPIRLAPRLKARSWGGSRLRDRAVTEVPTGTIGEAWLLSDLSQNRGNDRTIISEGPHAGRGLHDLIGDDATRRSLLGRAQPAEAESFPLLLKLLDARESLSMQAHPGRAAVNAPLKDELWLVLDCTPDAFVYRGARPGVTLAEIERGARDGSILDLVVRHRVKRGDAIMLDSGVCHALGAGILAAEVQTASDTTYRLWDWERNDPARPLQIVEAIAAMKPTFGMALPPLRNVDLDAPSARGVVRIEPLHSSRSFDCEVWVLGAESNTLVACRGVPTLLMPLGAEVSVEGLSSPLRFGEAVVIPAEGKGYSMTSTTPSSVLVSWPHDPLGGHDSSAGVRLA